MKRNFKTRSLLSAALITLLPAGLALATPKAVPAPIDKLFIPEGFDDNDTAEIILHGDFPNGCFKVGEPEVRVRPKEKTIDISATSWNYDGGPCLQVITPFIQVVRAGVLEAGEYRVSYMRDGLMPMSEPLTAVLNVRRRTTEAPDDYLYANVENAFIDFDYSAGKQQLVVQGTHPIWLKGCQVIREVRTYFDPEDVLVVLPITELVEGPECDEQVEDRGFIIRKGLSQPFTTEGLLHVRSMSGTSVNTLVSPVDF